MFKAASYVIGAAIAVAVSMSGAPAAAATVTGVYGKRGGIPLGDHQLHFENRISGDIYLARTAGDGSFSSDLPPGTYDLRAEHGFVLKSGILVSGANVSVGQVSEGAPLDVRKPFEREGVAPALVDTGAPATAHVANAPGPSSVPASPAPVTPAAPAGAVSMSTPPQ